MLNFTTAVLYVLATLGVLYLDKTSETFRSAFFHLPGVDFVNERDPGHDNLVDNNNLYEHGLLQLHPIVHDAKHDNIRFDKLKFRFQKMRQHDRYVDE